MCREEKKKIRWKEGDKCKKKPRLFIRFVYGKMKNKAMSTKRK